MRGGNYYNEDIVKTIRNNIKTSKKAKEINQEILKKADERLSYGNEFWWDFVTANDIPRCATPGEKYSGCPNCGDEFLNKYGTYGWKCLTLGNTFKIQCPNCNMKFPSNDFKKYYESGLNENGFFERKLADESLLVNELYPQYGKDKFVDDGTGYIDENGHSWAFIAYYNHWGVWHGLAGNQNSETGNISTAVKNFSKAWINTSDVKYAITGLLLLYRISLIYPSMDLNKWMRFEGRPYRNSDGHRCQGKVVGAIWETALAKTLCQASDALIKALRDYPTKIEEAFKPFSNVTATEIEKSIIDGIIRQIYPGVKNGMILGNEGMHQCALAAAAVCMGECDESKEWLDFLFKPGKVIMKKDKVKKKKVTVTGGNILGVLENKVNRDGLGDECSLGYNSIWLRELYRLADILSYYPNIKNSKYDINNHPKMHMMYKSYMPWVIDNRFTPGTGDYARTGDPGVVLDSGFELKLLLDGYNITKDSRILDYINLIYPDAVKGEFDDLRIKNKEEIVTLLNKAKKHGLPLYDYSDNECGYGNCVLRQPVRYGNNVNMYYGRTTGHGHQDKLNFEIISRGLNITPDLGYPEFCEREFVKRVEWNNHTVSHNCVMVNDKCQKHTGYPGVLKGFEDDKIIKNIDVDSPEVYDETNMYNRSLTMIETSKGKGYFIDFFRVDGGYNHKFSLHGCEGDVDINTRLIKQEGTVAGEDIKYGERPDRNKGGVGSGLSYLYDVEKTKSPGNKIQAIWSVKDTWNILEDYDNSIYYKAYLLGKFNRLVKAKGNPPANKPGNPEYLYYLLAEKEGENLKSRFTSVYEVFENESDIVDVKEVEVISDKKADRKFKFGALKIILKDRLVDYVISSIDEDSSLTVDSCIKFKGRLGFLRVKDGKVIYSALSKGKYIKYHNESILENKYGNIKGHIVDFQKEMSFDNFADVKFKNKPKSVENIIGRFINIKPAGNWNASYKIIDVIEREDDIFRIVFDRTTIIDTKGEEYIYIFNENAPFEIPGLVTYEA